MQAGYIVDEHLTHGALDLQHNLFKHLIVKKAQKFFPCTLLFAAQLVLLGQWSGLPGLFFGLASGFGFPWLVVCILSNFAWPVVWLAWLPWLGLASLASLGSQARWLASCECTLDS